MVLEATSSEPLLPLPARSGAGVGDDRPPQNHFCLGDQVQDYWSSRQAICEWLAESLWCLTSGLPTFREAGTFPRLFSAWDPSQALEFSAPQG